MAYTMKTSLPCEVVSKIVHLGSELKMKERLKNGWAIIHDEMMWRESHVYSCAHHFCDVQDCNCYHRYPGFLLRRVDSGAWLPGLGETRLRTHIPTAHKALHAHNDAAQLVI